MFPSILFSVAFSWCSSPRRAPDCPRFSGQLQYSRLLQDSLQCSIQIGVWPLPMGSCRQAASPFARLYHRPVPTFLFLPLRLLSPSLRFTTRSSRCSVSLSSGAIGRRPRVLALARAVVLAGRLGVDKDRRALVAVPRAMRMASCSEMCEAQGATQMRLEEVRSRRDCECYLPY